MKTQFMRMSLALAAAAALVCSQHATAQQHPAGYKDPSTATIMSVIVPGGGHLYSGETTKGAMILGVGLGGLLLGTALSAESVSIDCDDNSCEDNTSYLPMAAGYLLYVGSWVYGIMDASNSADRMNTSRGIALGGMQVQPAIGAGAGGGTSVGLEVRF